MKNILILCFASLLLTIFGCSSRSSMRAPEFYPNAKYSQSTASERNGDTRYCMSLADEYVQEPEHWKNIAKKSFKGAVAGTAAGAVGGSIVSKAGRGAGIGAASGAILGLLKGLDEAGQPNPSYEKFVEHCLAQKGYQVFGWS